MTITSTLEKYAQVISSEMMDALKKSAQENRISLDLEIAMRLMASINEQDAEKASALFDTLMQRKFSTKEAFAECKRKREAALYLYEMEKLRLFMQFQHSLPRNLKENFQVINVKEAAKIIQAEFKAERRK